MLYRALEPSDFSAGETTDAAAAHLARGGDLNAVPLQNAFARAARASFSGLAQTWAHVEAACGQPFQLSGAGPALFSLARDRAHAREMAGLTTRPGVTGYAVRTVRRARASVRLNGSVAIGYP
jgi:4-diphosphocytidyl-2C-methyl-D-erythritol kinase